GREKKTVFYLVNRHSSGALIFSRKLVLMDEFLTEDELRERVTVKAFSPGKDEVLFDHLTPIQGSWSAYRQSYMRTFPLFNLSETRSILRPHLSFIEALEEKELPNNVGVYKRFDSTHVSEDRSALFLNGKGSSSQVSGE